MTDTQIFTTQGLKHSHRLPYWRDYVCDAFVELNCESAARDVFDGQIISRQAGDLRYSRVTSSPQHVIRDKRRIAQSDADCFLLSLQLRSQGGLRQGGREAIMQPGEFALYDVTRPYDLIFENSFDQLVVRLPRQAMKDRLVDAEDLTAISVSSSIAAAQMARTILVQLSDNLPELDGYMAQKLQANALDLVASALSTQTRSETSGLGQSQIMLLQRILSFIDGNLADPNLRSETIAEMHQISERYLRKLFEKRDHGVAEWIWKRRLENAKQDLSDPSKKHLSVATIAYDWGFKDAGHFSRAFKAQFACSPRDIRRQLAN